MSPDSPTPSAFVKVPRNAEHFEANQDATNRERRAYIDSLSPEEQARFAAVEKAVAIIEEAKIPFFLWCAPEPAKDNKVGMWYYGKEGYHERYSEESMRDLNTYWPAAIHAALQMYTRIARFTIPIYHRDTKELITVYGMPETNSHENP